ncbi:MAG: hypothetical protein IJY09_08420 [Lachnospiraceae bacterium]|nr:hypothetical protein [Lachnospiraceae bacterium]
MNRYQMMLISSITLILTGTILNVYHFINTESLLLLAIGGGIMILLGLFLLGSWIGKAYTYICMDCFLRIDLGVVKALTAPPAGGDCRRVYCPKCRKRTNCKARRISLRAHVY